MALSGVVILNKQEGMTSQTAVRRLARIFGAEKAGHTGTLDPMATGVLPVLIGRAVKASEYLTEGNKHYLATLRLGLTTDTEDTTGTVLSETDELPDEPTVLSAIASFVGAGTQIPPMYSSLKVGGQKLVDLARRGVTIERTPRPIEIFSLSAEKRNARDYALDVVCTKGTYIRTLCADIGRKLGCGGVMASLTRLEAAGFPLENAATLDEYAAMSQEERERRVISVETLFSSYDELVVGAFFSRLLRAGQAVLQRKLGCAFPAGTRVRLADESGFFALGEVSEDGERVKTMKLFVL